MAFPDRAGDAKLEYVKVLNQNDLQKTSTTELELGLTSFHAGDAHDPLHWPLWLKITILVQTSVLAALGGLNTATINPALNQIAQEFHVDVVRASYQTTVCIALNGIAPFIWIPLAHRHGRRPVWLVTTLLGFISILSCAYTKTFQQLLVARVFNGLFPVGFALGVTTVVDLFPYHQRGRAMGFFTVTVANGSHIAPIIGGLLGQYCGWRWIFKFLAVCDGVALVVALFCLPETIRANPPTTDAQPLHNHNTNYNRNPSRQPNPQPPRHSSLMSLYTFNRAASLSPRFFLLPTLRLLLVPTAVFPATYYAAMYGFASILPAVTAAAIFTEFFHWDTLKIGLTYGGALTAGGILGEVCAGSVCDWTVCRAARRERERARVGAGPSVPTTMDVSTGLNRTGITTTAAAAAAATSSIETQTQPHIRPSLRLLPIYPGVLVATSGLLVYGFSLQYRVHPSVPLVGMGLSSFGLQVITTTTYTYAVDCLHLRSSATATATATTTGGDLATAELAQLFNLVRQGFGMTFAFYVVRLGDRIGYQWTFLMAAGLGGLAFLPVSGLARGWFGRDGYGSGSGSGDDGRKTREHG